MQKFSGKKLFFLPLAALLAGALIYMATVSFASCTSEPQGGVSTLIAWDDSAIDVYIDTSISYQTIEGFGFFGAQNVWWDWSGNPAQLYTDAWADKVLNELGLTMWRSDIDPHLPVDAEDGRTDFDKNSNLNQDATWAKKKPVIEGMHRRARENGVDLKMILTVWSPPGQWKDNNSAKNGGHLKPEHYVDYGNWLVSALDLYTEIGVDVYGLSLQNEPAFEEPYNSAEYTGTSYAEMLKAVVPVIKAKYPGVLIFGAESLLAFENAKWAEDIDWQFHRKIIDDPAALAQLDAFAVHGYSDGVLAEAVANHRRLWLTYNHMLSETGKPSWITETSGYVDTWLGETRDGNQMPGAFGLGQAIASALKFGHISAWVWWQGSELDRANNEFALMDGFTTGKRYQVSRHFYRYIRPGAVMLESNSSMGSEFLNVVFRHPDDNRLTIVLVNSFGNERKVNLIGDGLPSSFMIYQTTAAAGMDFRNIAIKGGLTVPAHSVVTMVSEP